MFKIGDKVRVIRKCTYDCGTCPPIGYADLIVGVSDNNINLGHYVGINVMQFELVPKKVIPLPLPG